MNNKLCWKYKLMDYLHIKDLVIFSLTNKSWNVGIGGYLLTAVRTDHSFMTGIKKEHLVLNYMQSDRYLRYCLSLNIRHIMDRLFFSQSGATKTNNNNKLCLSDLMKESGYNSFVRDIYKWKLPQITDEMAFILQQMYAGRISHYYYKLLGVKNDRNPPQIINNKLEDGTEVIPKAVCINRGGLNHNISYVMEAHPMIGEALIHGESGRASRIFEYIICVIIHLLYPKMKEAAKKLFFRVYPNAEYKESYSFLSRTVKAVVANGGWEGYVFDSEGGHVSDYDNDGNPHPILLNEAYHFMSSRWNVSISISIKDNKYIISDSMAFFIPPQLYNICDPETLPITTGCNQQIPSFLGHINCSFKKMIKDQTLAQLYQRWNPRHFKWMIEVWKFKKYLKMAKRRISSDNRVRKEYKTRYNHLSSPFQIFDALDFDEFGIKIKKDVLQREGVQTLKEMFLSKE